MELNIKTLVDNKLTPNSYVYLYYLVHKMLCPIPLPNINLTKLEEKGFIKLHGKQVVARVKAIQLIEGEQYVYTEPLNRVEEWIGEWRDLFPAGVKTGGYYVKGSLSGCTKKMIKFIRDNKGVTKDQIFRATEKYIEEYRKRSFQYMKVADYFISKDNMSTLASYIEQLDTTEEYDTHSKSMTDDI